MPAKNKPKRLDRARSWRVARRKKKITNLIKGVKRSRPKRPKKNAYKIESVKKSGDKITKKE